MKNTTSIVLVLVLALAPSLAFDCTTFHPEHQAGDAAGAERVPEGKVRGLSHMNTIADIQSDKYYVYTAGADGQVRIWKKSGLLDPEKSAMVGVLGVDFIESSWATAKENTAHDGPVLDIFVDDGYIYSASEDHTAKVWSKGDYTRPVAELKGTEYPVLSVAADQRRVYTASQDGKVIAWSRSGFSKEKELPASSIVVYADGEYVYTADSPAAVAVWSAKDLSLVKRLEGHTGQVIRVFADEDYIYSSATDKSLRVWSRKDLSQVKVFTFTAPELSLYADGDYIYSADAKTGAHFICKENLRQAGGVTSNGIVFADDHYVYTNGDIANHLNLFDRGLGTPPSPWPRIGTIGYLLIFIAICVAVVVEEDWRMKAKRRAEAAAREAEGKAAAKPPEKAEPKPAAKGPAHLAPAAKPEAPIASAPARPAAKVGSGPAKAEPKPAAKGPETAAAPRAPDAKPPAGAAKPAEQERPRCPVCGGSGDNIVMRDGKPYCEGCECEL